MSDKPLNKPGNWKCGRCDSRDESLEHSRHCNLLIPSPATLCCMCDKPLGNSVRCYSNGFGHVHWHCAMNYETQKHTDASRVALAGEKEAK